MEVIAQSKAESNPMYLHLGYLAAAWPKKADPLGMGIGAIVLAFGILAWIDRRRKNGHLLSRKVTVCWPILIVGGLLTLVIVYQSGESIASQSFYRMLSQTNLRELYRTMYVCSESAQYQFPSVDSWCDHLFQEMGGDLSLKALYIPKFDAVPGESIYAMNANLAGKKWEEVPKDTVLLFESEAGKEAGSRTGSILSRRFAKTLGFKEDLPVYPNRWNQFGGPEILTPNYHEGKGCCVVYVNGQTEYVTSEKIPLLRWTVEKSN